MIENNYLVSIQKQFLYYKMLGEKAMNQLEPDQLFISINEDTNSIATIVKHISGNMLSRWTDFLTSDGEKEWRNRDAEFENDLQSKEEVLKVWNKGWNCLENALESLKPEQLSDIIYIRNEGHTVIEAINKIGSMFYGPILAMFLLAIIGNKIKATAANIGLVCGVLTNVVIWLFFENIFWFWWNAIGALVTLFLGTLISFILPQQSKISNSKITLGKLFVKENLILFVFFLLIITFCYLLPIVLVKP